MAKYSDIVDALHVRFATVTGLKPTLVMNYEPTSIQDSPALYSVLDRFEKIMHGGQVQGYRYFITSRLVIRWQENEQAEIELMAFLPGGTNSLAATLLTDPTLALNVLAYITAGTAGYTQIAGTLYRTLDYTTEVLDKNGPL